MTATPEQAHRPERPDEPLNVAPVPPLPSDKADMAPPEQMTEEESRLLADTMPGDGPGGD